MDFALDESQVLLQDSLRTLLEGACPTSLVREAADDRRVASSLDEHLASWVELAQGPAVDLCICFEQLGAFAAPGAFAPTTLLFTPLLEAAGHPLAERAFRGEVRGTVALADRSGRWAVHDDPLKCFVWEPTLADFVAVLHRYRGSNRLAVVERLSAPVTVTATLDLSREFGTLDASSLGEVDWSEVRDEALESVLRVATVATAADMIGTAKTILDKTIEYAAQRIQFDRPIGSFQAVKHKLADMALAYERAWSAVYYSAMCIDADDPLAARSVHVAKASAGSAATLCAKDGLQIHGGIGYTWENDLHLYVRRVYGSESMFGTTQMHEDEAGRDLLV